MVVFLFLQTVLKLRGQMKTKLRHEFMTLMQRFCDVEQPGQLCHTIVTISPSVCDMKLATFYVVHA
jgi:hypothetical protein